jgi:protease-4
MDASRATHTHAHDATFKSTVHWPGQVTFYTFYFKTAMGSRVALSRATNVRSGVRLGHVALRHVPMSQKAMPPRLSVLCHSVEAPESIEPTDDVSTTMLVEELPYVEPSGSDLAMTRLKLFMKLNGAIAEQPQGRFSSTTSLPELTEALRKAALDPRIKGICVKIDPLQCGWSKLQEIKRHLAYFKASGKFSIAYLERASEKEYYLASAFDKIYCPPSASISLRGISVKGTFLRGVLDKIGIEPEVRRIGNYKSAGDQILRKDMSEYQREQLTELLDDIYEDFVDSIAKARSKSKEEIREIIDTGLYDMSQFEAAGLVDGLLYEDQINDMLKEKTDGKEDELRFVRLKRYRKVSPSAFGLNGKKTIAIVRCSGAIVGGEGSNVITAEKLITQLRALKKNKKIAAVVLRVDSPGGDALASDLMWREIQKFGEEKPIIASMSDVAASGGYYMSMACQKIVAESLTITGSIGVVTGKFSLAELYEKIGYVSETISRGAYAEILNFTRSFTDKEAALFDKSAQHAYEQFRNKAAASRGMNFDEMEKNAQGRVYSGIEAKERGLVDEIGGLWKAVEIAKEAAGISQDEKVSIKEISRSSASPISLLARGASVEAALALVACGVPLNIYKAIGQILGSQLWNSDAATSLLSENDKILLEGMERGQVLAQLPELEIIGSQEGTANLFSWNESPESIF